MCHLTPHALKNVKSRPPRNPTKFDVVAKFRETISTEKSVSSSEILKNSGFSAEITILPFIQNLGFSGVSHATQIHKETPIDVVVGPRKHLKTLFVWSDKEGK